MVIDGGGDDENTSVGERGALPRGKLYPEGSTTVIAKFKFKASKTQIQKPNKIPINAITPYKFS